MAQNNQFLLSALQFPEHFWGQLPIRKAHFILRFLIIIQAKNLCLVVIGFISDAIIISHEKTNHVIELKPAVHEIGEISVMPDSTIFSLLRKAYRKIPDNYPNRSRYKGFYRSSMKQNDGDYIYFTESLLDIFKDSYAKRNETGQAKILKSRKYTMPGGDSIFRFALYGGIYTPIQNDPVYFIASFINPKHFKDYIYSFEGNIRYNNREVMCISFSPNPENDKGTRSGKFYIDKTNFAYIYFEFKLSPKGLAERNDYLKNKLISQEGSLKMLFDPYQQKYYLKGIWKQEVLEYKGKQFINKSEYLTTEVQLDSVSPIPYNEQAPLGTVISWEAVDYRKTDWRDYTQIEKDSVLMKNIGFVENTEASRILSHEEPNTTLTSEEKPPFIIFTKIYLEYGVGFSTYSSNADNIALKYEPLPDKVFMLQKEIPNSQIPNYYFQSKIAYRFNNAWRMSLSLNGGLNKHISRQTGLHFEYHACIKNVGRQFFTDFSLGFVRNKFGYYLTELDNAGEPFKMNRKKINADEFKIFSGFSSYAFTPELSLSTKKGNFTKFVLTTGYKMPIYTKHLLYVKESAGFPLFRKTGTVGLDSYKVDYYLDSDNMKSKESGFGVNGFYFNVGIRFEL